MPNWVTDNSTSNTNQNQNLETDMANSSSLPTSNVAAPPHLIVDKAGPSVTLSTSMDKAEALKSNEHSVAQGLIESSKDSPIILSPDTPPESAVPQMPTALPVPDQPQNAAHTLTSLNNPNDHTSQQPANGPLPINQPVPMRSVSTSILPNGTQPYSNPSSIINSSVINESPAVPTNQLAVGSIAVSNPTTPATRLSPAIPYSFQSRDRSTVTFSIAPEYAQRTFCFTKDNHFRELTTLDILTLSASALTATDLERAIKKPSYLIELGKSLVDGYFKRSSSRHEQQQQPSTRTHQSSQNRQIQAGPSRPTSSVSSNGYSYNPQHNPLQTHHSIESVQQQQNRSRPASRQSVTSISRMNPEATPLHSPGVDSPKTIQPPEVRAIQQEFVRDLQGVEQMFGLAWERLKTASESAFDKMGNTYGNFSRSTEQLEHLKSQLAEGEKKLISSQTTVLRLTESETAARTELQNTKRKLEEEIEGRKREQGPDGPRQKVIADLQKVIADHKRLQAELQELQKTLNAETAEKNKAQAINRSLGAQLGQCATELQRVKTQQAADFSLLTAKNEKILSLEKEHGAKINQLTNKYFSEVDKLKKEIAETSRPIFGAHSTNSPKTPKSPADPAAESAKLRSLLKAKNEKFAELQERHDEELTELKTRLGKDPKEWEKEIKEKLNAQHSSAIGRLEKKVNELQAEKSQAVAIPPTPVPDEQIVLALTKILNWCESLQKSLVRSTTNNIDDPSSATSSPVLPSLAPPFDHGTNNETSQSRALLDRANDFIRDMKNTAATMLSRNKDREEKVKKLQGQVELLKVQLNAAQSDLPALRDPGTAEETNDLKVAFGKIIAWGENIQTLMGKTIEQPQTDIKPLERADKFQREMHEVFEEMQIKNKEQKQSAGSDDKQIKELEDKLQEKEKYLQANLQALLAKSTQYDETVNELTLTSRFLESVKSSLKETENELKDTEQALEEAQTGLKDVKARLGEAEKEIKAKEEEIKKKDDELKIKGEELKNKEKELIQMAEDLKNMEERLRKKEEELQEKDKYWQTMLEEARTEAVLDVDIGGKESAKQLAEMLEAKDKLMKEMNGLQMDNKKLLVQIEEQQEKIDQLQKDMENEQNNVDTAEEALREAMDRQFKQREEYVESEIQLKEAKDQRNKLKEQVQKLQEELKLSKKSVPPNTPGMSGQKIEPTQIGNAVLDTASENRKQMDQSASTNGNGKRPISRLYSSSPKISASRSSSPDIQIMASKQSQTPSQPPPTSSQHPPRNLSNTPLFLPNDEDDDRSFSQTPVTPGVSVSVQRPKKKKRVIDDSDDAPPDQGTPAPVVSISQAPSITHSRAGSVQPTHSFEPVSKEWLKKNINLCIHKKDDRVRCKLCFVNEKKAAGSKGLSMKVEQIKPLPLGMTDSEMFEHFYSHGETLRRLKDKRIREGKERASPEL
ncbi:uncharacterized protein I206_107727 [Kwoniella pini CBS 10737]|uniref:Uncharacterized protein n=1 Tax=Kwoniella pini CBS 10737 TaxID=1296096 RepID=A0A1B9HY29_9TREE|nr:uncharacterized protein I206_06061 [Kwoniella pini CBS 10737]OCF48193.1 hypothetical protein I206_06061 [Kwoniella pini CBS 10737]